MNKSMKAALAVVAVLVMTASFVLFDDNTDAAEMNDIVVATIGTTEYTDFNTAFTNAKSGDVIELKTDVNGVSTCRLDDGRNITINLNGNTITFVKEESFKIIEGTLSLDGPGTVKEPDNGYFFAPIVLFGSLEDNGKEAKVVVNEDVVLKGWSGIFINGLVHYVDKDGKEVEDYRHAFGVVVEMYGSIETGKDSDNNDGHAFYINGSNKDTGGNVPVINIYEGSTTTSTGNGIYGAGYAKWNIYGGSITAPNALSIKSGEWNIYGGLFTSTGEHKDPAVGNSNGSEDTGAALSITSNDGYARKTSVNVTGGTFVSQNGYGLYEGIATKDDKPMANESYAEISVSGGSFTGKMGAVKIDTMKEKRIITGGVFSSDVNCYVASGYDCLKIDSKYYVSYKVDSPTGPVETGSNSAAIKDAGNSTSVTFGNDSSITIDSDDILGNVVVSIVKDDKVTVPKADVTYSIDIIVDEDKKFTATITLPVNVPSGMTAKVESYDDNGEFIESHDVIDTSNGKVVFTTTHTTTFAVSFEPAPSYPGYDDDDDELPFIPGQNQPSKSDDTTTLVAIAAGAAVVAIIAVLIVGISKGKL